MRREGLFTRAKAIGSILRTKLLELAERHEIIGEVRGRGLLQGIELVADRKSRRPFPRDRRVAERVVRHMRDNRVVITAGVPLANFGRDGDHLQISPPFTISEQEVSIIIEALDDALGTIQFSGRGEQ